MSISNLQFQYLCFDIYYIECAMWIHFIMFGSREDYQMQIYWRPIKFSEQPYNCYVLEQYIF